MSSPITKILIIIIIKYNGSRLTFCLIKLIQMESSIVSYFENVSVFIYLVMSIPTLSFNFYEHLPTITIDPSKCFSIYVHHNHCWEASISVFT